MKFFERIGKSNQNREYVADDSDWDDLEFIEEEESGYYNQGAERTGDEYGASDEVYARDENYAQDEYYVQDEYYTQDEYYADEQEGYGEEYYTDEDYYAGDYLMEESLEEIGDYPADVYTRRPEKKKSPVAFWNSMGSMDRIVAATGVFVLIFTLITGAVYASAKMVDNRVSEFVDVGSQLADIDMIGEKGLMAVADAKKAQMEAAQVVAEKEKIADYNEAEYSDIVTVALDMVSIQKDLKIKFTNQETDKLIPNVPFTVKAKDPQGKVAIWTDDDLDGIIYKKGITPGTYEVTVDALTDAKYDNYILPVGTEAVEVKKDIAYEKVNVKNEIKSESQVNAALEDTKKKETVVESSLTDTVEWVESRVITNTYIEVEKSSVPDPVTLIAKGNFMRTAAGRIPVALTSATVSGNVIPTPTPTPTPKPSANPVTMTLDKTTATAYTTSPMTINATVSNATTNSAVIAETSDSSVATVSVSGKTITVTGVSKGSATITVKYVENGVEVMSVCAITVKTHPKEDEDTKLLDSAGRPLFVQDGDTYREAVYADYYAKSKFYVRGDSKYTGWQTLDGKVYFFDASGKKVTGEQVIQGAKYNFDSNGALVTTESDGTMGIDVSKWNGNIDWNAVKNSGVSYVIIRCGYRGSSAGALIEDPKYRANIQGAINAGLKVGVYFFTQAVDEVEAVEEASMVLELVSGYRISYPIFLDVESSGGRADKIDVATRTAVCRAFCETIREAGYTSGIYANKTWLNTKLDASALSGYTIWLAQYAVTPTYGGRYDMWQYSDKGRVSGISGNVDLNISYLGY